MAKANLATYRLAHQRIAAGFWTVDSECGLLIGRGGKIIGNRTVHGYLEATIYGPDGRRIGRVFVHRVIWEHIHGPVPEGMQINHRNLIKHDNRLVNLEVVTPLGNVRHAFANSDMNRARGERSAKAKLTEQAIREIRVALANGETPTSIARRYGIAAETVRAVRDGRTWRHVT